MLVRGSRPPSPFSLGRRGLKADGESEGLDTETSPPRCGKPELVVTKNQESFACTTQSSAEAKICKSNREWDDSPRGANLRSGRTRKRWLFQKNRRPRDIACETYRWAREGRCPPAGVLESSPDGYPGALGATDFGQLHVKGNCFETLHTSRV
jgi:hypothetical protein